MTALKDQFLLDPSVTFLNHGSFGACPKPVFETYQRLLENQPSRDLARQAALEIGMIYFNDKDYARAISSFKYVQVIRFMDRNI